MVFWPNVISNEELWEYKRKKIRDNANKPREIHVNGTYIEEEPLCLKQTLSWNPQRRQSTRTTVQKDLEIGQSYRYMAMQFYMERST